MSPSLTVEMERYSGLSEGKVANRGPGLAAGRGVANGRVAQLSLGRSAQNHPVCIAWKVWCDT